MSIQARIVLTIALFFIGVAIGYQIESWHSKALLEASEQALLIAQQKAQEDGQKIAKDYEDKIAMEKVKSDTLQKEWNDARIKNKLADCPLGASAVGLLKGINALKADPAR